MGEIAKQSCGAKAVWTCQGHTFTTELRVLDLGSYDIILSMNWLSGIGAMWVNWLRKPCGLDTMVYASLLKVSKTM